MKKIKFNPKTFKVKRKKIPTNIRMTVIIVLGFLTVFSSISVFAITSEEQSTIEKNIALCNYNNEGRFFYMVYLKNNTVYNKTILLPGEEIIFRKITDHINASFKYNFDCDCQYTINGTYTLIAKLQTDIWKKEYDVIPETNFETNSFEIDFPVNITQYENIVSTINEEIGITAQNPIINITCKIVLTVQTDEGPIYEFFSPQLSISLKDNIIEIKGELTQSKNGALETTKEIIKPNNNEIGNSLTAAAIFLIPLIPFTIFTRNDYSKQTEIEKQIKKIKKKYGEWIVEIESRPKSPKGTEIITTKSLEDLVKTSEELGKPIFYYKGYEKHEFYILDDMQHYKFTLSGHSTIKRIVKCPSCDRKIEVEGRKGEIIEVECPNCRKKGNIKL